MLLFMFVVFCKCQYILVCQNLATLDFKKVGSASVLFLRQKIGSLAIFYKIYQ